MSSERNAVLAGRITTLAIGGVFVLLGVAARDVLTVLVGLALTASLLALAGPGVRWLRRGDGPYATSSPEDQERAGYARIRYPGDHQGG